MTGASQLGLLDRALHRIAFATWPIQAAMGDIEEIMFKAVLQGIAIERPVFIAGLPRAGTTLLLELLENTSAFASYRYSDMPFLLTPLLWRQFTRSAQRDTSRRERAHGDGMTIGLDSPEAMEEVAWRTMWPDHYRRDRITPWGPAAPEEFDRFFRAQMKKVIALRSEEQPAARRYLSKNNGNIARLGLIRALFPDAVIIVAYRHPLEQAMSLLSQHRRFLAMHRADPFSRRYMAASGHYDCGENLLPVDFDGWLGGGPRPSFEGVDDWLRYWCAAYGFLSRQRELGLQFVSYDALCARPHEVLGRLEAELGLAHDARLLAQADRMQPPVARGDAMAADPDLLAKAEAVLASLQA